MPLSAFLYQLFRVPNDEVILEQHFSERFQVILWNIEQRVEEWWPGLSDLETCSVELCWIYYQNFFTVYVSEGQESIANIPTKLPCLGELWNLGQLPVQQVLGGTDKCVLWIFIISPRITRVPSEFSGFIWHKPKNI